MRNVALLPLAALVAVAAGCSSEVKVQSASSVPQRDLTLVSHTPQLEVASPLETGQLKALHRTVHHSRMAARLAPVATAPVHARPQPIAEPASPTALAAPADDHELLPGETVTVIPVSTGPSVGTDKTDEIPGERGHTVRAHGGGGCRGRGRGPGPDIGMAPAPRPDFR